MKRLIQVALAFLSLGAICLASDEDLARGLPGTYSRADGLRSESLALASDSTYLFRTRFDVGQDEERGSWAVKDAVVILSPKTKGQVFKTKEARFLVLAHDGDLALRPEDDEPERLFLRKKDPANNSPEATLGQRPPAEPSPSSGAPQL